MSKKEKIVPITSAATEKEQSKTTNKSIAEKQQKSNLQAAENLKNFEQGVLETIAMEELYDTVYPPKDAVVDKLIYNGTYLFVGAPKIGKSFLMAQLGYHVNIGLPFQSRECFIFSIRGRFQQNTKKIVKNVWNGKHTKFSLCYKIESIK